MESRKWLSRRLSTRRGSELVEKRERTRVRTSSGRNSVGGGNAERDASEVERRKYYVDGISVEIGAEAVWQLDAEGKRMRLASYAEFSATRSGKTFERCGTGPADFRRRTKTGHRLARRTRDQPRSARGSLRPAGGLTRLTSGPHCVERAAAGLGANERGRLPWQAGVLRAVRSGGARIEGPPGQVRGARALSASGSSDTEVPPLSERGSPVRSPDSSEARMVLGKAVAELEQVILCSVV